MRVCTNTTKRCTNNSPRHTMVSDLPSDIVCRLRLLQRIGQEIGVCHYQNGDDTIGVTITAHWIDTFGILRVEWHWFATCTSTAKETLRLLNEHPSSLEKTSLR